MKKLFKSFPAVVVSGARQVGKSTLVQKVFGKQADYVVFDPITDIENARADPDLFLKNHKIPVILDEIQYAPELLSAIKREIDSNPQNGQFILTGSQQWGVMKSVAESLAGRAVFLDLEGFSIAEIYEDISGKSWLETWLQEPQKIISAKPKTATSRDWTLYEQLWRGWLPRAQFIELELMPDFYQAYLRTYIERDVRLISDISDYQLFGRFVRLLAALSAQEVNYSQIGRELGLSPKTSKRWIDILQSTYQWFEISAFHKNSIKRLSAKPKGYISDTGIMCAAQSISNPGAIASHPLMGALYETAVVADIRKLISIMSPAPNLYHWRSHGGAEVDLILEQDNVYYPIEIKAASSPGKKDISGITAFRKTYPELSIHHGLVLAPAASFYQISNDDYVLPWNIGFI